MSFRLYLVLFLLGLVVFSLLGSFQTSPGYMDADYYLAGGIRLAGGFGFSEEILWNYLDDPEGLPHPSHAYWMPAASLLSALGMFVFGSPDFKAAQIVFILIAALTPPLTAKLAYSFSAKRKTAFLAGLFAVFPGFYLAYFSTSDVFGLSMLCGACFFILIGLDWQPPRKLYGYALLCGLLAGVLHFSRAEGLLWLALAFIAICLKVNQLRANHLDLGRIFLACAFCSLGYLLVMAPWLLRNLRQFGTPLAPGGLRALWLNSYDELYSYPASLLTFQRWFASGFRQILRARLWAAGQNLQSALAVQGAILLSPFILIALWWKRFDLRVRMAALVWLLMFTAMTILFPYQGARGGFFHAAAALQPLFWALAPLGLESAVIYVGQRRGWNLPQAQSFFTTGILALVVLLTLLVTYNRLWNTGAGQSGWDDRYQRYLQVEQSLEKWGARADEIVMVNNAPGYYVANQRPALSIPYGDLQTTLSLAQRYQARYLLLEFDQIQDKPELYSHPSDQPGFQYLGTVADICIYRFDEP